jgi:retron-type reverse transcriptase
MKTYKHLFEKLCSWENLQAAYEQARKHKTRNPHVQEFDKHAKFHLATLHHELKTRTYVPLPLKTFILRDPKTRKICVSDFRDRIVHHALINILQPVFEPRFIYDSHASQKRKGTLTALKRFTTFAGKVSKNGKLTPNARNTNHVQGYAFKADIYHYFETVDHETLFNSIAHRIHDDGVLWLVRTILNNYASDTSGKGMPLGNWTSQFFANIYLNELDQFVKHTLKAKYYLRYVDDFIILHRSKETLHEYELRIKAFLNTLKLDLHPHKCKIIPLGRGITFLGFRIFYHYKLVRQRNVRKIRNRLSELLNTYETGDAPVEAVLECLNGWNGYAKQGNTYRLRTKILHYVEQELRTRTETRRHILHAKNSVPPNSA